MKFWDVFEEELVQSVLLKPSDYALANGETAEQYAARLRATLQKRGVRNCTVTTTTFRRVARRFHVPFSKTNLVKIEQEQRTCQS